MTCSQEFNALLTIWFCKYNGVNYFLSLVYLAVFCHFGIFWPYSTLFKISSSKECRWMTCSQEFNALLTIWFCKYNGVNYFLNLVFFTILVTFWHFLELSGTSIFSGVIYIYMKTLTKTSLTQLTPCKLRKVQVMYQEKNALSEMTSLHGDLRINLP